MDEKCFLWALVAGTYLKDEHLHNPQRPGPYSEYESKFNLDGISFPVALKDIPKFERRNNISISVYGFQEGSKLDDSSEGFAYPLKVSKEKRGQHVDLLFMSNDKSSYYCLIKNFSKFALSQSSKHAHKTCFCRFFLHGFSSGTTKADKTRYRRSAKEMIKKLREHEKNCFAFSAQRIEFPENSTVKFNNIKNQLQAPFTVYADFESILKELTSKNKYQEHVACSYAYHIVSNIPGVEFEPRLHVGLDAAEHFIDSLQIDLNDNIVPIIEKEVEMI